MPDTPNKFYLTTPIYYVNARPRIGHAYSTIAADVIARRHRLLGDDTFLLTGTDEHGQKVQRSAEKAGIPPQQFTDEVSATFQNLWKRMGITNNDFIRTTDERHKRGVQHLWKVLEHRGAIYLSTYTGQYSVGEEMFVEGPPGTIGPDGKPTETVTEENYFFRLSDYQEKLIDLIESGELHVQPETTRNEVLSFLRGNISSDKGSNSSSEKGGNSASDKSGNSASDRSGNSAGSSVSEKEAVILSERSESKDLRFSAAGNSYLPGALKDLSISRTTFDWGIPVPGNPKHVIYVWLDALANYITAVGYGSNDDAEIAKFNRYWPADLHLVGKEITRFHCVYWPAFLMAAGLRLPKSVVANGWLLFEESKMSKSRGNVVRTETILDAFGPLCPPVPNSPSVLLKGTASAVPSDAPQTHAASAAEVTSSSEPTRPPTKAEQDLFAADVLRYFLLREIPFGQDGSFSFDALITRYNADLANGYGNLVSRTFTMVGTNFSGSIPEASLHLDTSESLRRQALNGDAMRLADDFKMYQSVQDGLGPLLDCYELDLYLEEISKIVARIDGFITKTAPWKLAKSEAAEDRTDLGTVLLVAVQYIRLITALLYPVIPYATASVWRQLGLGSIEQAARNGDLKNLQWGGLKPGTKLGPLAPIFPRADKGLAQIMTDMENPTTPPAPTPSPEAKAAEPTAESLNAVNPATDEQAAPATPPAIAPTITIDDFAKIDLRVAQIVVAERIPKADKLLRLEVDLGTERRQILSGIAEFYTPEELIGRRIAIIANLAPRKMRGLESHGMLLAASGEDHASKPILATFSDEVPLGSKIR